MPFSDSTAVKLMLSGIVHPLRALLRHAGLLRQQRGVPEGSVSHQRVDINVVALTLQDEIRAYSAAVVSNKFRVPACKRTRGEPRGSLREIWEDTRLEAMQRLMEHGAAGIDDLASAEEQRVLSEALRQIDKGPQNRIWPAGDALRDTISETFCTLNYLQDRCIELGIPTASARKSFIERCEFVSLWQQNSKVYQSLFPNHKLPTIFSILWDEVTRLAKEIAVAAVFGHPLEVGIQRYIEYIRTKYAEHPMLEECCEMLTRQQLLIRAATVPEDLLDDSLTATGVHVQAGAHVGLGAAACREDVKTAAQALNLCGRDRRDEASSAAA
jgi:hypothetical protein